MGKTKLVVGRAGRPLDVERTQEARTRHALGRKRLNGIFHGGSTPKQIAAVDAERRVRQGQGPELGSRATRKNWTRAGRRAKAKTQRLARRRNR